MEESVKNSFNQEQLHDILFSREIGWQEIIYDLINTEQLDPWDINISVLADRYLQKIKELEEDFFISSKVLLAAAFLLRIKTETLLNKYVSSIDEILFGKKAEETPIEEMDFDTEDIPALIPSSPLPRFRKVSLQELMESLGKAIVTENRRIKKEISSHNFLKQAAIFVPKNKFVMKDKMNEVSQKMKDFYSSHGLSRVSFNELIGKNMEERIISFVMLLHLENQRKIWLEQPVHFGEIYIWPRKLYLKHNPNLFEELIKENAQYNVDEEEDGEIYDEEDLKSQKEEIDGFEEFQEAEELQETEQGE